MVFGAITAAGNDIKSKEYMADFQAKASAPTIFDKWKSGTLGTNLVTGISLSRLAGSPSLNQQIILSGLENVAVTNTYHSKIVHQQDSFTCGGNATEDIERNWYQDVQELEEVYNGPVRDVVAGAGSEVKVNGKIRTAVTGRFTTTAIELYMRQSMVSMSAFVGPRTMTVYGADVRTSMVRLKLHGLGHVFTYGAGVLTNGLFHLESYNVVGVAVGGRVESIRMLLRNVGMPVTPGPETVAEEAIYAVYVPPMVTPPLPARTLSEEYLAAFVDNTGFSDESANVDTTT